MRDIRFYLKPKYAQSHALVIGINAYQYASPLGYAVNDARAVASKLADGFGFEAKNVTLLVDADATASAIRKAYLRFCGDGVELDDRVLIFFAGHGMTRSGMRGEVGYLVPYDGNPNDLSTLLRWDDLTRNVELIAAKHVLFIMDACYGGLAVTRNVRAGSARFLKDMLKRVSRQVLTAGKADETVADAGGPMPGHSVFTGHLLQGLDGAAATTGGVITASGVMAYVYNKVSIDAGSFQTPHFGHIDGDGDFIFLAPRIADEEHETQDVDDLMVVPYPGEPVPRTDLAAKIDKAKTLLGETERAIELHDFVIDEVKRFLTATSQDAFKPDGSFTLEELIDRLARYEAGTRGLSTIEACMAYWAAPPHRQILRKAIARSVDRLEPVGGLTVWLNLRWYPLVLQAYCAGIAAVEASRYDTLADVMLTEVKTPDEPRLCFQAVTDAILEFARADIFKKLPGHDRNYAPMSEYLYKLIQPQLDDALFMGRSYESAFDEFEIFLALTCAHARMKRDRRVWGPIGRFGWKHSRPGRSPLAEFIERAKAENDRWVPLQHGFFNGSPIEFAEAADAYIAAVKDLHWY